jgi:tape measure domain-containing protein
MADAAQLKLQVGLDLAFFRAELGKVATAASAYYYPINLLINKKNLTTQLEAIGRNLGTKKYRIDLADTSVVEAAKKVDDLAVALKKLSGSIQIDFNAGGGTKPIGTAMKEMAAKLAKESKGDINEAVRRMVEMRGAAPFGKGVRGIPGFTAAAKGMGIESAFKLFFQELNQVDPQGLKKALDDGSVMMMQENREIKQKFDKIQSSAEGLARDLRAMGEAAQATGKASLSDGGKTLYPQNYGLKIASLLGQIEKLDKELKRVSAASGVELLDNLKELSYALRATSNSFVGIAGFSDTLDATLKGFNTATQAAARATNAYTDRIRRRGGVEYGPTSQKLLPPSPLLALRREMGENMARQYQAPSRGVKGLLPAAGKTPGEAITAAYITELRRSFSSRNAIAGLLPPALEASPGSYRTVRPAPAPPMVETRAELFARRTRQAYINSAARAGDERQSPLALPPGRDRVLGQPPLMTAPSIGGRQINRGVGAVGAGPGIAGRGMAPPSFQKGFGSQEALAIENATRQTLKFGLATDIAQRSLGKMNASQIPFIGGLRGVAGELGQATKQVLLYGTAYRALAAITSIPGQILNAAKSQQQYTNGLKVATEETGTFAKELLFVDNVQRAFGLNLETTRTGFTRLYASMAPTGFDSGSIEKLFTGISAATAALQLTPDKAERVIYAFGQMASKGQIMSEELKGQLGDVLPGALAIFAKSAGMSVKEFSKAMEDGEFIGNRFREVFAKVSDELMNRFGTGAQAAGKSLQGLLSTVGGEVQRTLESFAPLANAAAQATLAPLVGMLRDVSMAAQIAMGEQDRVKKQLEDSRKDVSALKAGGASAKEIKAAEDNVAALAVQYEVLNEAAKDPAIAQQVKNIEAFVTEVQKAATFTMNLAGVIGNVLSPLITVLGGNFTSVIGNLALLVLGFNAAKLAVLLYMGAVSATTAVAGITRGGAIGATLLAGAFRLLGAQATAADAATKAFGITVKGLAISTGFGALVVLIGSLAAAFLSVGDRAKEAADRTKQSIDSMVDASRTGNVSLITNELSINKADRQDVETLIAKIQKLKVQGPGRGGGAITLASNLQREAKQVLGGEFGSAANKASLLALLEERRMLLKKEDTSGRESLTVAQKRAKLLGLNKPTPDPAANVDDDAKKVNLESYYKLGDDLSKMRTAADIDRATAVFDFQADRMNALYDMQEARANSFQKASIQFQREMFNIEMQRQKANLDAQNQITKAQGSVARGGSAAGAYLQGDIGPTSTGPHFDVKKVGGGYFDRKFLDNYVQVNGKPLSSGTTVGGGTFAAHQRRGSSGWDYAFGAGRQAATLMGGAQWLEGKPTAHGEQRRFQIPTGEQFQFLHGKSEGIGAIPPGKIAASQARTMKAELATNIAITRQHEIATRADEKALLDQQVAMQKYVSSIMPIAEQELQIQLLKKRSELTKSGISQEQIDTEMQIFETRTKSGIALKDYTRLIEQYENAVKTGDISQGFANKAIAGFRAEIDKVNKGLPLTVEQIKELAAIQSTLKLDKAVQDLQNRLDMARALTPEAEMRTRLQQQGYAGVQLETLFETEKATVKAEELKAKMQGVASTIGDAFSTAFQGIINGSMSAQDALAGMFQSIGQSFVKMAAEMIAQQITMITLGFIMKALGLIGGIASAGNAAGAAAFSPANAAGLDAIPGQAFNLPQLSGTMIDGGGIGAKAFAGPLANAFAKGGAFSSGVRRFATGGIVNGPTLFPFADGGAMQMGLMGEAGPEAIMPLQRGSDGSLGVRAAMGGNGMGGSSSPVLNMNFETSTINGVEYVSRDQLEAAMAQTRRQASRDGANKGMAMTLDKIQQSPQTRRRIGM